MREIERGDRADRAAGPRARDTGAAGSSLLAWAETCLENSPAPVSIVEREGYRVLYANPVFRQVHSLSAEPAGLPVAALFDPTAASQIEALVDRGVVAGGAAQEGLVSTASTNSALSCSVWPLMDPQAGPLAIVMIESHPATDDETIRALRLDVTQRLVLSALRDQISAEAARAAAAAAEADSASKSRFLATMSHELRTPLHAIGGYVELIGMGLHGPVTDAQREDLSRIRFAQDHILGLINAVLSFSKLESGRTSFDIDDVMLQGVVDSVLDIVMARMVSRRLIYNEGWGAEPLVVRADPEKLRQILLNLMTNAIKFTAPGGTITTTYEKRDGMIAVHIQDTGRGIAEDQLQAVFEPFVQVGGKLSSGDQGIGLGLSISRELARGMGGELTAVSTLGVGSTFTLTLQQANRGAPPSP